MEKSNKKGVVFARYLWLYGEIAAKGPVAFAAINDDWINSSLNDSCEPLPHKTFENHRKAIEDMFNISIECNRADNTYYIDPSAELDFCRATLEMLNGALLFNRVQTDPQMRRFIRVEQSGEDSSLLFKITDALTSRRNLMLRYRHNYDPSRETSYCVKPIAVKQFRRRWYLIAELPDTSTYSFSLDRVIDLVAGDRIEPSNIDVDELFADSYGIIREKEVDVATVTLKVEREEANYFISRPLHSSQKVEALNNDYAILSLRIAPTYDFIMEILSHGPKVEVVAPESLRRHIAFTIDRMSALYKN
ncbi:MAG: WYL domain-containing protein [Muribaculaceae bacterium]|nr:WYL domain-containing protein [Muribaculaceae bacterium]